MTLESLTVAQAQLVDELARTSGFTMLQTDGTTSLVNTFQQLILEQKKQLHIHLELDMSFQGSAKSTSEIFQEILLDTDCVRMP